MESLIRIFHPAPPPPVFDTVGEFSGTYTAAVNGTECVLKLWFNAEGFVCGSFTAEGETLPIRAGFSGNMFSEYGFMGVVHGFLLEPVGQMPIAMFRAQLSPGGLSLQIGIPEFEDLLERCDPEHLAFNRVLSLEGWAS
jgi:hypothetical protein